MRDSHAQPERLRDPGRGGETQQPVPQVMVKLWSRSVSSHVTARLPGMFVPQSPHGRRKLNADDGKTKSSMPRVGLRRSPASINCSAGLSHQTSISSAISIAICASTSTDQAGRAFDREGADGLGVRRGLCDTHAGRATLMLVGITSWRASPRTPCRARAPPRVRG